MRSRSESPLLCGRRPTSCSPDPSTLRGSCGPQAQTRPADAPRSRSPRSLSWSPVCRGAALDGPDRAPSRRSCYRSRTASSCTPPSSARRDVVGGGRVAARPRAAPYPAWNAFDQDTGRFLFTIEWNRDPQATGEDVATSGSSLRGAIRRCGHQLRPAMQRDGVLRPGARRSDGACLTDRRRLPRAAQVWGFDGSLHDEIGL